MRLQAAQLAQQGYTDAAQLMNEQADNIAKNALGAQGLALQGQQQTAQQTLQQAGLQEEARQFERQTALQQSQAQAQLEQQARIASAQGVTDVQTAAMDAALRTAGLAQQGETLNRQMNAQEKQVAMEQFTNLTNILQSGEISRAELAQSALSGKLDSQFKAIQQLTQNALQYENLSTVQRQQANDVLSMATTLSQERERTAGLITSLTLQAQMAISAEDRADARQAIADSNAMYIALINAVATGVGYYYGSRNPPGTGTTTDVGTGTATDLVPDSTNIESPLVGGDTLRGQ